jgi:hypothetical protein
MPRTDALLRACARSLMATTGLQRCGFYLREPTSRRFRGRLGVPEEIDATVRRLVVGGRSDAVTAEIVRTARPVFVADARSDERMALAAPRQWNTAALLGVPVLELERVIGVFLLDGAQRPTGVDDATLEHALTFGILVGRWLTRTRRAARLPPALRELEQERSAATGLARAQPRLSAVARTAFNDGVVLRILAEELGRPVVLIDADGALRGRERPQGTEDVDPPPDAATIAALRDAVAGLGVGGVRIVEPSLERGVRRRWAIAPVIADDEPRGLLAVAEAVTPLARLDVELVRRVADILGHGAERAIATRRLGTDHRHLRAADRLGIVPRAARTSPPGAAPALLIAFVQAAGATADSPETTRELETRLGDHPDSRDGVVLRTDDGLVVIVPAPADPDPSGLRAVLRRIVPEVGLPDATIGITHAAADEMDLAPALDEARRYVDWGRSRLGAQAIVTADDLGPARLFLTPPERLEPLAREVLGPLLDDDPGMRDLLATVVAFFARGRNVRAASVLLGVHENTIRYRFNRARQLTGRDVVGDVDDQLLVQAALLALPPSELPDVGGSDPDASGDPHD